MCCSNGYLSNPCNSYKVSRDSCYPRCRNCNDTICYRQARRSRRIYAKSRVTCSFFADSGQGNCLAYFGYDQCICNSAGIVRIIDCSNHFILTPIHRCSSTAVIRCGNRKTGRICSYTNYSLCTGVRLQKIGKTDGSITFSNGKICKL